MYNAYNMTIAFASPNNSTVVGAQLNVMICPSTQGTRYSQFTGSGLVAASYPSFAATGFNLAAGDYAVDDQVANQWDDGEQSADQRHGSRAHGCHRVAQV